MSEDKDNTRPENADEQDPNSPDFIKLLIIAKVVIILIVAVIAVILFKTI